MSPDTWQILQTELIYKQGIWLLAEHWFPHQSKGSTKWILWQPLPITPLQGQTSKCSDLPHLPQLSVGIPSPMDKASHTQGQQMFVLYGWNKSIPILLGQTPASPWCSVHLSISSALHIRSPSYTSLCFILDRKLFQAAPSHRFAFDMDAQQRQNYILNMVFLCLCLSLTFLLQRGKMKLGEDIRMIFKGSTYKKPPPQQTSLLANKDIRGPVALTTPGSQSPNRSSSNEEVLETNVERSEEWDRIGLNIKKSELLLRVHSLLYISAPPGPIHPLQNRKLL